MYVVTRQEIDEVNRPGQLGVAIGRVATIDRSCVLHCHPSRCVQQPTCIQQCYSRARMGRIKNDLSCCHRPHLNDKSLTRPLRDISNRAYNSQQDCDAFVDLLSEDTVTELDIIEEASLVTSEVTPPEDFDTRAFCKSLTYERQHTAHHTTVNTFLTELSEPQHTAHHTIVNTFLTELSEPQHTAHHTIVNTLLTEPSEPQHTAHHTTVNTLLTELTEPQHTAHHTTVNTLLTELSKPQHMAHHTTVNTFLTELSEPQHMAHHTTVNTFLTELSEPQHTAHHTTVNTLFTELSERQHTAHHTTVNTLLTELAEPQHTAHHTTVNTFLTELSEPQHMAHHTTVNTFLTELAEPQHTAHHTTVNTLLTELAEQRVDLLHHFIAIKWIECTRIMDAETDTQQRNQTHAYSEMYRRSHAAAMCCSVEHASGRHHDRTVGCGVACVACMRRVATAQVAKEATLAPHCKR